MITTEQYRYIYKHDVFRNIPIDKFDKLAKHIQFRKIPKDQILFFEGDKRDKLFLLKSGYGRIEQYDKTDSFSYIDFVKPQTVFPYGGLFQDEAYHYTVVAVTDVECFYIPVKEYEEASLTSIHQMKMISIKLSKILRFHELRLRNMVTSSASDRVIQSLGILLIDICKDTQILPFHITALEIAKLSGATRETVSTVLKKLCNDKIIDYRHKKLTYLQPKYFLEYMQ